MKFPVSLQTAAEATQNVFLYCLVVCVNSSGQLNHQRRTGSSAVLRQNIALGVPSRGFVSLPARGGFCRAEAFANSEAPVSRLHMPRLTLNRGRKRPLLGGYAALMLIFALRFFSSAPAQIHGSGCNRSVVADFAADRANGERRRNRGVSHPDLTLRRWRGLKNKKPQSFGRPFGRKSVG